MIWYTWVFDIQAASRIASSLILTFEMSRVWFVHRLNDLGYSVSWIVSLWLYYLWLLTLALSSTVQLGVNSVFAD